MPWINKSRIDDLEAEIDILRKRISRLAEGEDSKTEIHAATEKVAKEPTPKQQAITKKVIVQKELPKKVDTITKEKAEVKMEQRFGAMLPVWLGGIALALSGFFMVKYSIESGLLSPTVRVVLGAIMGAGLLYSAYWVRSKPDFANGERISQSLTGAGIATLYVVSFAATRLYDIMPVYAGFIAMAGVTAAALVLSLRHGAPIALLGMAGGFLAPALLSTGGGNALGLFIYLYFTASGLLIVVRRTKLWWLSIPTIILSLLWVLVWLFSSYTPADSIYLTLFLIGIAAAIVINTKDQFEKDGGITKGGALIFTPVSILNYIGLGGTLGIMGLIATKSGYGTLEWGLFWLLSLGSIGLAYFNSKLYSFVPLLSMAVNIVMLYSWQTTDYMLFTQVLSAFAVIYIAGGYLLMFRSKTPVLWAGLAGASSLSYYLLAYYKLHHLEFIPLFWGALAFIFAMASVGALFKVYNSLKDYPYREHIYAIFTIAATAFISLALTIELDREFLSLAIAAEVLALSWINNKVSIKALRPIVAVLACIFGLLLFPQILLLIQLTAHSLIEARLSLQSSVPIVKWPLFQLGVPAVMFLGGSYFLKIQNDNKLVRIFEVTAITLIAVMGYYITRNALHPNENVLFIKANFTERGLLTNVIYVYGLACLVTARKFKREAIAYSGIVLCAVALFRIGYFDMFIYNPLWSGQQIQGVVLLNTLLLPFGLPLIWSYFARKEITLFGKAKWTNYIGAAMLAIVFVLITANVRHIFHGEYLNSDITTNAEIYSYSAAWLVLGIGLLFGGIVKKDKMLRYASLSVILLTVGKVFLYDASELDGLYRVFSFLCLGLSLIGISYFYTRFVFNNESASSK